MLGDVISQKQGVGSEPIISVAGHSIRLDSRCGIKGDFLELPMG